MTKRSNEMTKWIDHDSTNWYCDSILCDFIEWVSSRYYSVSVNIFPKLCIQPCHPENNVKCHVCIMYAQYTGYFMTSRSCLDKLRAFEVLWFGQCYAITQYRFMPCYICSGWRRANFRGCCCFFM